MTMTPRMLTPMPTQRLVLLCDGMISALSKTARSNQQNPTRAFPGWRGALARPKRFSRFNCSYNLDAKSSILCIRNVLRNAPFGVHSRSIVPGGFDVTS